MTQKPTLSILLASMLLFSGCLSGTDDNSADTDSDDMSDITDPILYEGDEPGECSDGADNDQDGLFDCDDPNCIGSPSCKTDNDENNTQQDSNNTNQGNSTIPDDNSTGQGNGTIPDDNSTNQGNSTIPDDNSTGQGNGTIPDDNNATQGNGTEEPDKWQITNLTDDMIQEGVLDETDCGILYLMMEWDTPSIDQESELRSSIDNADSPPVDFWIAKYQNSQGYTLLPSLDNWRNGAVNVDQNRGLYVFDDNEVLLVEEISGSTYLGTVCNPSQRESIQNYFEVVYPEPVPFVWTAATIDDSQIQEMYDDYETASYCDIILVNEENYVESEYFHNIHLDAIDEVGATDVGYWVANMTSDYHVVMPNLVEWLNESLGGNLSAIQGWIEFYVIIDDRGLSIVSSYESIPRDICAEGLRQDVFKFFYEVGYLPSIVTGSDENIDDLRENDYLNWYINATEETITQYELIEIENQGWHGLYPDLELECSADLNTEEYPYQTSKRGWLINDQEFQSDSLNLSSGDAEIGDVISCVYDAFDPVANLTFTMKSKNLTVQNRQPLLYNGSVTVQNSPEDEITCNFDVINPNQVEVTILYYWMIDIDGDGSFVDDDGMGEWYSNYSEDGVFDPNEPDTNSGFSSVQVSKGQHIKCFAELHTPDDAVILLEGVVPEIAMRFMSTTSIESEVN